MQFGDRADDYIAAAGHYGAKSRDLIRHYATDMGFEYLSAESKEEYLAQLDHFVTAEEMDKPIIFEVFTDSEDESTALQKIRNLVIDPHQQKVKNILGAAKKVLGEERYYKLARKVGRS